MKKNKHHIIISVVILFLFSTAQAKIQLPSFFSDNMVLQQKSLVRIWGNANPNSTITLLCSWNKKTYKTVSDKQGSWKVSVNTTSAGGPYTISIHEQETYVINQVMLGEVWFCSGQSNMEMPMRGFKNQPVLQSNEFLLDADNNNLRLFDADRNAASTPQTDATGKWKISNAENARNFSAVAFMYGYLLQKKLQVPVGIIVSCWGGTRIQSWMSKASLIHDIDNKTAQKIDTSKEKHKLPTTLYNGMIAPFVGYGIKGFLWYQGESNRHEPVAYANLFPQMVSDWRGAWNSIDTLPFYYVQIAPYGSKDSTRSVKGIREAQMKAMKIIPHSGMASTMDIGDEVYIHPSEKKKVSERLLYWALSKSYGFKGIDYCGPIYRTFKITNSKINIQFDYAENGLTSFGKELLNFEIAGSDKQFYSAVAKIEDDKTITVWSERVLSPVAVRYAYKEYVKGDLFNTAGLPASSFRTDDW